MIEKVEIVVTHAGPGPAADRKQTCVFLRPEKIAELERADKGVVGAFLRGELLPLARKPL